MKVEILIENNGVIYEPVIKENVVLTTERRGMAGKLTFSVVKDDTINFTEGNPVSLRIDGVNAFYGFVFTKKRDKGHIIDVTAYDQTRYLKNKDTLTYTNKTAADVIKMLAADFGFNVGEIDNTSYVIAQRIEEDVSLFDMVYAALDLELSNKKAMYIFYDDFGKLTLKSIDKMKVDLIIDEETGENFEYTSTIDDKTYNKINLIFNNEETGKMERYIALDGENINKWGVLQYHDKLQKGENGKAKADELLTLYNNKTRKLKVTKAFGDIRIRAGSMPVVKLNLGDIVLQNYMLVDKCVHTFKESEHFMDLTFIGGEFVG